MDLESECSALESVEDNELIAPECLENLGETETGTRTESNGNCHVEHVVDDKFLDDTKVEDSRTKLLPMPGESSGGSIRSSPPTATKGRGLKKWRRIPREVIKEANSNVDSNKKRGLTVLPGTTKQGSDGSISSTTAMLNVLPNGPDGIALYGDSGQAGGPVFAARADSENSEGHSSRSSTAASAPRMRHDIPPVVGLGFDKNGMGSQSVKSWGTSPQPGGQQGKGRIGTSKKARGIRIEKENSHSSMESDSRSSNFVFVQGTNSMTSNGRESGMSANYDEEYSDDAQNGGKHLNEEARDMFRKNEAESGDVEPEDLAADNSWEMKQEKSKIHVGSVDSDALVESIAVLHSAQEALEREVQKLRDVGKEDPSVFEESTSANPRGHEPSSSEEFQSGESRPSSSNPLETQMIDLKWNVVHLQSKLEEARAMLELKEAKVVKLESSLNVGDMNSELEELFKQRIEAEVEYLAISRSIQNLRAGPIGQIKLMVEQKNLASEHVQVMNKLDDAESKAAALKRQAEKLETTCEEIVETEDVLILQNRVCRFTWCFMIQLILLLVVVYLLMSRLYSHDVEVVPPT